MCQTCHHAGNCRFFANDIPQSAKAVSYFRQRFCLQHHGEACARRRLRERLGDECVPDHLFPTDDAWADAIIEEAAWAQRKRGESVAMR